MSIEQLFEARKTAEQLAQRCEELVQPVIVAARQLEHWQRAQFKGNIPGGGFIKAGSDFDIDLDKPIDLGAIYEAIEEWRKARAHAAALYERLPPEYKQQIK